MGNILKRKREYGNLGEHPCIVNTPLGPLNVDYREVSLYICFGLFTVCVESRIPLYISLFYRVHLSVT